MPTVREASGLALSSRNGYLGSAEQQQAARLYAVLQDTSAQLRAGGRNYQDLEGQACAALTSAGFRPDYVAIRSADLSAPSGDARQLVILAAVRLGKARLIDNLQVSL
jgi:pantoate--beta-alanine ligase